MSTYLRQVDPSLSEDILLNALKITKDIYGRTHLQSATMVFHLASWTAQKAASPAELQNAEKLYDEYLSIIREVSGPKSSMYEGALQQTANFYNKFNKGKANELMAKATKISESKKQEDNLSQIFARENLANKLMEIEGDYIQALGIYEQTVKDKEKLLGKEDSQYLMSLKVLAWLSEVTGDYKRAIGIYELTNDFLRLAGVYRSLGEQQRALEILKKLETKNKDDYSEKN